ncbi:1,3-propanediol dehydrogenase [Pelotomaculum schinkii]|uniref:1,3-propanediol dehydrogenase n=1 Tax=Pelotomaculum schinkii TaxID=78350 RepID=A0A4Y7RF99_9FIRM|nr:iron-containing alcohol dehydrogenase [Pelotomaculum schinkii]TEB07451.1 1,3-propanediol dehydrogenase [Pelotomaculum schinkii]
MSTIKDFSYSHPIKTILEAGGLKNRLAAEVKELGTDRILLVTDPGVLNAGLLNDAEAALKNAGITYKIFSGVEPNPRTESCYKGYEMAQEIEAGAVVAVGGGSPIDVSKAIALLMTNGGDLESYEGPEKYKNAPRPTICVPTTAGTGSETTAMTVITVKSRNYKMTILGKSMLPNVALLDPSIFSKMPPFIAASTGMDALTHAIESYINRAANPFTDSFAVEAIRLIGKYLRHFVGQAADLEAATGMLVASNLAGIAFDISRLGDCHAMAHPLGGFFDVPHGVANSVLLPITMDFNLLADHGKYKIIAELLGEDVSRMTDLEAAPYAVEAVKKLSKDVGIPENLVAYGVTEDKIPQMSKDAMLSGNIAVNPRVTKLADIENMYRLALK